jgi:hypothetical protein
MLIHFTPALSLRRRARDEVIQNGCVNSLDKMLIHLTPALSSKRGSYPLLLEEKG